MMHKNTLFLFPQEPKIGSSLRLAYRVRSLMPDTQYSARIKPSSSFILDKIVYICRV